MNNKLTRVFNKIFVERLRRSFPYDQQHNFAAARLQHLEHKYYIWRSWLFIFTILCIPILTYILGWALYEMSTLLRPLLCKPGETVFIASKAIYYAPAFAIALAMAAYCTQLALIVTMGLSGSNEFTNYCRVKERYNHRQAAAWLRSVLLLPIALLLHFSLSCSVVVSREEVVFRKFFDVKKHHYKLDEVKSIIYYLGYGNYKTPVSLAPHYCILFTDDSQLATSPYFDNLAATQSLIRLLNKPVDTLEKDRF